MARIEKPLDEKTDGSFPGLRVQPSPSLGLGDSASASPCSGWVHCEETRGSCLFKEMAPWEPAGGPAPGPRVAESRGGVDASAGAGAGVSGETSPGRQGGGETRLGQEQRMEVPPFPERISSLV